MKDRALAAAIVVVTAALGVALVYPEPVWAPADAGDAPAAPETPSGIGPYGSAHVHASLYFMVDGSRKELTEAYIERDPLAHFHALDGVIHVEATGVDLGYTLDALGIALENDCLRFGVEDERYCAGDGQVLQTSINGTRLPLQDALQRGIRQGDSIVVYHGPANGTIPDELADRRLPDEYRPGTQGEAV